MVVTHLELETDIGEQMEDSVLDSMWVKAISSGLTLSTAENHRKSNGHKKKTVKKTVNNVKANNNHIMPRLQEPNSEKPSMPGLPEI